MNLQVYTQTHEPDQTKININEFDLVKSAAQLLYGPVLVFKRSVDAYLNYAHRVAVEDIPAGRRGGQPCGGAPAVRGDGQASVLPQRAGGGGGGLREPLHSAAVRTVLQTVRTG